MLRAPTIVMLLIASSCDALVASRGAALTAARHSPAGAADCRRMGGPRMDSASAVAAFRAKFPKDMEKQELPKIFSAPLYSENSIAAQIDPDLKAQFKERAEKPPKKLKSEVEDEEIALAYSTLSELYGGDENVDAMVAANVGILSFDPSRFSETKAAFLKAFTEPKEDGAEPKYTEDDVVAMVVRNPLLVGISADGYGGADQAGDDTMYMSYVVAATRPLGPVLLYGTFFLLLTPALKKIAGIE
mmetsp:Transcript_74059/g.211442  ORF Transcript_74059/g.211442 Transcript_74059/m.211442 type:complete len:245 (+) Transcript_74059:49-783(+)